MRLPAAPGRALWSRLACVAVVACASLLGGCAGLPFLGDRDDDAAADAAKPEPQVTLYELEVVAPEPLRTLLLDYLDLSRFRKVPQSDAITEAELARLAAAAPAQARSLLETEGYFDATVQVAQSSGAAGLPQLTMTVVAGPRVTVRSVEIESTAALAARAPAREQATTDRLETMRRAWTLPAGQPFRQADWSSAKNASLGGLRGDGYPKAEWQDTHARIDATAEAAALSVVVEPGPLFHLGPVRVEGVSRYDEEAVRRLALFFPGEDYSEKKLLDFQDRIVKVGLFEGASVELDTSGPAEAAPVIVKVKELTQHQATFGIGYSANTGPRVSVEHFDRKVFGWSWIAHSTLTLGPDLKSLGTEFTSYPRENLWRNLVAANLEQLEAAGETRDSRTARIGRSKDTTRFDRLYYLEASRARVHNSDITTASDALSANYHWLRRDLDNTLLPTDGNALALQGGAGYGKGTLERSDRPGTRHEQGPFLRTYARWNVYKPAGSWFINTRLEAGEVFVRDSIAVPDTLLFRAGGDNSVRGYGYRTLGPRINREVLGGRVLLTGSVEAEHTLLDRLPALLGAVFVDAGNAADKWSELKPVVGVGAGVHYRSPVGPLRLDLAYGIEKKEVRLHLSIGVVF